MALSKSSIRKVSHFRGMFCCLLRVVAMVFLLCCSIDMDKHSKSVSWGPGKLPFLKATETFLKHWNWTKAVGTKRESTASVSSGLPCLSMKPSLGTGLSFARLQSPCVLRIVGYDFADLTHCFLLNQAGCHAKQRLSFHKQAKRASSQRGCIGCWLGHWQMSSPAKKKAAREG